MAHQPIIIGEYSVFLEETNSTNDALKILYSQEALPDGAVLYTNFQTKGRGQQNNVWESEPGENLLLSTLLQPQFLLADEQIWVNVMVSLALRDAAEELSKTPSFIKWPNDIYVQNKKVAGVLIENVLQGHRMRFSIVGIGLNLNQQQFKAPNAQSLSVISGAWIDPKPARLKLLEKLTHYYALLKGKQHNLLWDLYHQYLYGKGKLALFQQNGKSFEAEIMGIDKKGRLHLLVQDEIKSFAHKELEFIKILE